MHARNSEILLKDWYDLIELDEKEVTNKHASNDFRGRIRRRTLFNCDNVS